MSNVFVYLMGFLASLCYNAKFITGPE